VVNEKEDVEELEEAVVAQQLPAVTCSLDELLCVTLDVTFTVTAVAVVSSVECRGPCP
jgi:hypothetical protein